MSSTQATFSGRITDAEFNQVQSALLPFWSRWYLLAPIGLLALVGTGTGWSKAINEPSLAAQDLLFGLVVLGVYLVLLRYGRRRAWRSYLRLHGTVSGRVSASGIELKTDSTATTMAWAKLLGYRLSKDLALVFYTPRCAFFLPRSFFAGEQEWMALHEVLTQHSRTM